MEKQDNKMIKVYKKVAGTLALNFKDYETMLNDQRILIRSNQEFTPVPMRFLLSMFFLPDTLKTYQIGWWSLDKADEKLFKERAAELGFYFQNEQGRDALTQPELLYSELEVKSLLERGRTNELKEIIEKGAPHQKQMLLTVAKENFLNLNTRTVQLIEDGLRVSITESDE